MTQTSHGKNGPSREGGTGDSRSTQETVESNLRSNIADFSLDCLAKVNFNAGSEDVIVQLAIKQHIFFGGKMLKLNKV